MALGAAYGAGPFAVYYTQPELAGPGCPCYGVSTTLTVGKVGPAGFEIINIDGSSVAGIRPGGGTDRGRSASTPLTLA